MVKCKEGYKSKNGKCVRKGLGLAGKKKPLGLLGSQILGFILIGLSFGIWYFRPFKECGGTWWNPISWIGWVGCSAGAVATAPIFLGLMVITMLGGIFYILKLDKLIF